MKTKDKMTPQDLKSIKSFTSEVTFGGRLQLFCI